jgi:amidase
MKTASRNQISYVISKDPPPVLKVKPMESFVVETEDALSGRVRSQEAARPENMAAFNAERDAGYIGANPVTGPIYLEGAEPGDTLVVKIEEIEVESPGVTRFRKALSPLGELFQDDLVMVTPVEKGYIIFNERIKIPIKPMVGTIGVAPQLESPLSGRAGIYGGNMDCPEVSPGNILYLPVYHPGGLLYIGDVHAAMGDAEIGNTAIEIRGRVRLTLDHRKGRPKSMGWPRVETPDSIIAVVAGTPLDVSLQTAFKEMILWMEEGYRWRREEAYLLLTQVADGRLCNSMAVRCVMPKAYL